MSAERMALEQRMRQIEGVGMPWLEIAQEVAAILARAFRRHDDRKEQARRKRWAISLAEKQKRKAA